jgi:hypothetical protein
VQINALVQDLMKLLKFFDQLLVIAKFDEISICLDALAR